MAALDHHRAEYHLYLLVLETYAPVTLHRRRPMALLSQGLRLLSIARVMR